MSVLGLADFTCYSDVPLPNKRENKRREKKRAELFRERFGMQNGREVDTREM